MIWGCRLVLETPKWVIQWPHVFLPVLLLLLQLSHHKLACPKSPKTQRLPKNSPKAFKRPQTRSANRCMKRERLQKTGQKVPKIFEKTKNRSKNWLVLSREWGNEAIHGYDGDSFPHSLLRASQKKKNYQKSTKTNMALENNPLEKEIPIGNHPCSGAFAVSLLRSCTKNLPPVFFDNLGSPPRTPRPSFNSRWSPHWSQKKPSWNLEQGEHIFYFHPYLEDHPS